MYGWGLGLLLLLFSACSGTEALIRQEAPRTAPWQISEPRAFDLKMPPDLFRGRLAQYPQLDRCHTQGLEIIDDQLVISCSLSNPRFKTRQSFTAESLLLSAPLAAIEAQDGSPSPTWQIVSLTEPVPTTENPRIAKTLLASLPKPLAWFIEAFYAPESLQYMMGHPSGLYYDTDRGLLWVSNAVYGPRTYSQLQPLNPQTLQPVTTSSILAIRDHLGSVVALSDHLLLSTAWGDPQNFRLIDVATKRSRLLPLTTDDLTHYQDCDRWNEDTLFCVGKRLQKNGVMHAVQGRLHVFRITGHNFDDLQLEHRGAVTWRQKDRFDTIDLGHRLFYYIEGIGDIEHGPLNRYGEFRTAVPLSQEGFAIGPDRRTVYFLPDDLPFGKLVRMELRPSQP